MKKVLVAGANKITEADVIKLMDSLCGHNGQIIFMTPEGEKEFDEAVVREAKRLGVEFDKPWIEEQLKPNRTSVTREELTYKDKRGSKRPYKFHP